MDEWSWWIEREVTNGFSSSSSITPWNQNIRNQTNEVAIGLPIANIATNITLISFELNYAALVMFGGTMMSHVCRFCRSTKRWLLEPYLLSYPGRADGRADGIAFGAIKITQQEAHQIVGPGKTPFHLAWKCDSFEVESATKQLHTANISMVICREIRPKAVGGGICDSFCDNFRP